MKYYKKTYILLNIFLSQISAGLDQKNDTDGAELLQNQLEDAFTSFKELLMPHVGNPQVLKELFPEIVYIKRKNLKEIFDKNILIYEDQLASLKNTGPIDIKQLQLLLEEAALANQEQLQELLSLPTTSTNQDQNDASDDTRETDASDDTRETDASDDTITTDPEQLYKLLDRAVLINKELLQALLKNEFITVEQLKAISNEARYIIKYTIGILVSNILKFTSRTETDAALLFIALFKHYSVEFKKWLCLHSCAALIERDPGSIIKIFDANVNITHYILSSLTGVPENFFDEGLEKDMYIRLLKTAVSEVQSKIDSFNPKEEHAQMIQNESFESIACRLFKLCDLEWNIFILFSTSTESPAGANAIAIVTEYLQHNFIWDGIYEYIDIEVSLEEEKLKIKFEIKPTLPLMQDLKFPIVKDAIYNLFQTIIQARFKEIITSKKLDFSKLHCIGNSHKPTVSFEQSIEENVKIMFGIEPKELWCMLFCAQKKDILEMCKMVQNQASIELDPKEWDNYFSVISYERMPSIKLKYSFKNNSPAMNYISQQTQTSLYLPALFRLAYLLGNVIRKEAGDDARNLRPKQMEEQINVLIRQCQQLKKSETLKASGKSFLHRISDANPPSENRTNSLLLIQYFGPKLNQPDTKDALSNIIKTTVNPNTICFDIVLGNNFDRFGKEGRQRVIDAKIKPGLSALHAMTESRWEKIAQCPDFPEDLKDFNRLDPFIMKTVKSILWNIDFNLISDESLQALSEKIAILITQFIEKQAKEAQKKEELSLKHLAALLDQIDTEQKTGQIDSKQKTSKKKRKTRRQKEQSSSMRQIDDTVKAALYSDCASDDTDDRGDDTDDRDEQEMQTAEEFMKILAEEGIVNLDPDGGWQLIEHKGQRASKTPKAREALSQKAINQIFEPCETIKVYANPAIAHTMLFISALIVALNDIKNATQEERGMRRFMRHEPPMEFNPLFRLLDTLPSYVEATCKAWRESIATESLNEHPGKPWNQPKLKEQFRALLQREDPKIPNRFTSLTEVNYYLKCTNGRLERCDSEPMSTSFLYFNQPRCISRYKEKDIKTYKMSANSCTGDTLQFTVGNGWTVCASILTNHPLPYNNGKAFINIIFAETPHSVMFAVITRKIQGPTKQSEYVPVYLHMLIEALEQVRETDPNKKVTGFICAGQHEMAGAFHALARATMHGSAEIPSNLLQFIEKKPAEVIEGIKKILLGTSEK